MQSAVDHYRQFGYTQPVDIFSHEEALALRSRFFEAIGQSEEQTRHLSVDLANWHNKYDWCREIVANPRIVDLVQRLFDEEDIMVWSVLFWYKEARDTTYIPWHQDGAFWDIHPIKTMTAWVALGDVDVRDGALHFLPGRQTELLDHGTLDDAQSEFITQFSGQIANQNEVAVPMTAGQACLFDAFTLHRSGPNQTDRARIGCGIRYATPDVTFNTESWPRYQPEIVMLRGQDRYALNPTFMSR